MLSEEINEKSINLAVQIGDMTGKEIKRALEMLIAKWKQADKDILNAITPEQNPGTPKHGRTTLKQLSAHNGGLSTIELKNPDLHLLNSTMKKYGVDFAVTKDGKSKHTMFFRGKDVDSVTHAFSQYSKRVLQKGMGKSSIKVRLANARVKSEALSADRNKEKNRSRGGLER